MIPILPYNPAANGKVECGTEFISNLFGTYYKDKHKIGPRCCNSQYAANAVDPMNEHGHIFPKIINETVDTYGHVRATINGSMDTQVLSLMGPDIQVLSLMGLWTSMDMFGLPLMGPWTPRYCH